MSARDDIGQSDKSRSERRATHRQRSYDELTDRREQQQEKANGGPAAKPFMGHSQVRDVSRDNQPFEDEPPEHGCQEREPKATAQPG
jgi:hypothetical protein